MHRPTALLLMALLPAVAFAGSKKEEKQREKELQSRVKAVSAISLQLEEDLRAGLFRSTHLEIGGGQNPLDYEVVFKGGTEADWARDPYAAPFTIRRITVGTVLPATGPATASFVWDDAGSIAFVHVTGPDISLMNALTTTPTDDLKIYYEAGVPFRVVLTGVTWDLPSPTDSSASPTPEQEAARRAAEQLQTRALYLAEAFTNLTK